MTDDWDFSDMFRAIREMMDKDISGGYMRKENPIHDKESSFKDIQEDDDHVYATVDLSEFGMDDDFLNVIPTEETLVIEFTTEGRWYRRTFPLPSKIDPITSKVSYKNFILDVILDKVKE